MRLTISGKYGGSTGPVFIFSGIGLKLKNNPTNLEIEASIVVYYRKYPVKVSEQCEE